MNIEVMGMDMGNVEGENGKEYTRLMVSIFRLEPGTITSVYADFGFPATTKALAEGLRVLAAEVERIR